MSITELELRMTGWLGGEYQAVLFEQQGQAVGYALFRHDKDYVYPRQFFFQREFRRQGIGRAALEWLRLNAWADSRVRVEVLVNNTIGIGSGGRLAFVTTA